MTMMQMIMRVKEVWRPVVGYEGLYSVTNTGRVKAMAKSYVFGRGSIRNKPEHEMKSKNCNGYRQIELAKDGYCKLFMVHQLVAKAFIDNPHNKPFVNHIDGDKTNNNVDNLEWCTARENNIHAIETGLRGAKMGENPRAKKVVDVKTGFTYSCAREAAITLGIPHSTMKSYLNGNIAKNPTGLEYAKN